MKKLHYIELRPAQDGSLIASYWDATLRVRIPIAPTWDLNSIPYLKVNSTFTRKDGTQFHVTSYRSAAPVDPETGKTAFAQVPTNIVGEIAREPGAEKRQAAGESVSAEDLV